MTERGGVRLERKAESVEWWTPLPLIEALGPFDLDPCGAPGHPTAKDLITLPADGLKAEWWGRVWLNPPYGKGIGLWLEKLRAHGKGTAIVPARTQTKWAQEGMRGATLTCFIEKKVRFLKNGVPGGCPIMPSLLLAYGDLDADKLLEADLGVLGAIR